MAADLTNLADADPDSTPLIPGRIQGVRAWSLLVDGASGRDLLGAIARDVVWPAGTEMRATCVPGGPRRSHPAPVQNCSCGIYAHHPFDAPRILDGLGDGRVLGVIDAWGRIEVHELGFRAEFARPRLLLVSDEESARHRQRVARVAADHGIPCRRVRDLEAIAHFLAEEMDGLSEDVVQEFLAIEHELVLEPDCVGYQTERGMAVGGHGLSVEDGMEESPAPWKPEVKLELRGTRMVRVAGTAYRPATLQGSAFDVGRELRLLPEPTNRHDRNAIAIWDSSLRFRAGYVPRALAPEIGEMLSNGRVGTVLSAWEWRNLRNGDRIGLHVLVSRSRRVRFLDPVYKALTAWDEIPF